MYNQIFAEHAQLLKAMSHPKRLEIINLLRDGALTVGEIQTMLALPQANLSQHLKVMRTAGIVTTKREGKEINYRVASPEILAASDSIREFLIKQHEGDDAYRAPLNDLFPMVIDPVCAMRLSPKTASYSTKYKADDYYFCAEGCLNNFHINPKLYAK